MASKAPVVSIFGEFNPACALSDALKEIKKESKVLTIELDEESQSISFHGTPKTVRDALEIMSARDVDIFLKIDWKEAKFSDQFKLNDIKHAIRKGKDRAFGEFLHQTTSLPNCFGSYSLRMVTPQTCRKHFKETAEDLKRCRDCVESGACCKASVIRKLEEMKRLDN
jgi:hypothetical protein